MINIPLIAQDKANHFIYGLLTFTVTQAAFGILIAAVVTALVAAAKEGYDFLHKDVHTPDFMDFLATVLGGALGLFNYLMGSHWSV